uniref:Uncharacterized protein n=1 Tax=Acrobeloides nanus TaxID=290746 RepID=A0A914CZE4_9BILA
MKMKDLREAIIRAQSLCEAPPDCRIVETSAGQGVGRNHYRYVGKDRGQLPKRLKACVDAKGGHFDKS